MESCVFIGTHAAVLDEKSRLVMPSGFRKDNTDAVLGGDFYITPHQDGFLIARPAVVWEGYLQSIREAVELDGAYLGLRANRLGVKDLPERARGWKKDSTLGARPASRRQEPCFQLDA